MQRNKNTNKVKLTNNVSSGTCHLLWHDENAQSRDRILVPIENTRKCLNCVHQFKLYQILIVNWFKVCIKSYYDIKTNNLKHRVKKLG